MKPLYADWNTTPHKDCLQVGEFIDRETLFHFRQNAGNQTERMIQMCEVADVIGSLPIFDTIVKLTADSPWRYAGQCFAGEDINRNPLLAPVIYICSRYRADTKEELRRNIEVAKFACEQEVAQGYIPIAPHLYFPRFMDDNNKQDRTFGMGAGMRLMDMCQSFLVVTVDGVISEGMEQEIKYMTETLQLEGVRMAITSKDVDEIIEDRLER